MEQQEAELHNGANFGAADAAARFLRELCRLRDIAGLGQAELAARAHYPRNVIEAVESGPPLPDLPVLSAYVRGCGGTADDVAAWEDRWRSVTGAKASPLLPAREAGHSDAADAGARIGAISAAADNHDPAAIMAALDRYAETMATDLPVRSTAGSGAGTPPNGIKSGGAKATSPRLTGAVPGMRAPSVVTTPPAQTDPSGQATPQPQAAPSGQVAPPVTPAPPVPSGASVPPATRAQPPSTVPPAPPMRTAGSAPTVSSAASVPQDPREPADEITADLVAAMAETPVFGEQTVAGRPRTAHSPASPRTVSGSAHARQLPGGFGLAVGVLVLVVVLVVLLLIFA
ncbi:MAG TPA: helix-turn-helix domain-containing protein [Trebonia sp.]|nr:helix-turn-helix domain-containing protein [Trebonia sp.]